MLFHFLLFLIQSNSGATGIGGFVKFGFNYPGKKAELLTSLSIQVKTPPPQNSNVDSTIVQPTGYWVVATPQHHDLVVTVKGPEGLIIDPPSQFIQYPFNSNVDFQIVGFSAYGQISTAQPDGSLIKVLSPLTVEVTNGKDLTLTTTTTDGTYSIGPLPPGQYTVSLKDAVAQSKTIVITTQSVKVDELIITDWPQNGIVTFPDSWAAHPVELLLTSQDNSVNMKVKTEESGRFSIQGLHVGSYHLKSAVDDIIIPSISFQISAKENPKPLTLKFEGIRVHGSVKYPSGQGLAKIDVRLNPGQYRTTTDDKGDFSFSISSPISQPQIEFFALYHTFSEVKLSSIVNDPIPHINANVLTAQICGKVDCPSANLTFTGAVTTSLTVTNGTFCISAPISQPVTINAASECGFEHNSLTVNAPTGTVKFARIKAVVKGHAICIGDCDTSTVFKLYNDQYTSFGSIKENGDVEFDDVEFGRYHLSINSKPSMLWSVLQNDIFVSSKEVNAEDIGEQTAFVFNVTVSHQMDVKCGSKEFTLKRGLNTIQVQSTIVEPNGCLLFNPIDLRTTQRIVAESIQRTVVVNGAKDAYDVYLNGAKLQPPFVFQQKFDEIAKVNLKTKVPYFSIPTEVEAKSVSTCSEAAIKFDVLIGIEYAGTITPAIEGVSISATQDNKVIAHTTTEKSGKFSLGSFPSNQNITLVAKKSGYKFTAIPGTFDFKSEKLSSVRVHFDSPPNVNTKGILLSISRQDNFAQHVMTDSSDDTIINGLEAGSYYLMPIFREHEFSPKQSEFNLNEGQELNLTFTVARVQFGISGEVRRITGESEPDVEIEANYVNGEKQIAVTDARGRFRIGGLNPNQTVTLHARASETSSVERITPPQLKIKMGTEEYRNVRFLSMKPTKTFDILGELDIDADFLPTMNVALMLPNNQVVERFTFPSKLSNNFFFTNLTGQKYNIIVASVRQGSTIKCEKAEVDFQQPVARVSVKCEVPDVENDEVVINDNHLIASEIAFASILVWIVFFNAEHFVQLFKRFAMKSKKAKKKKQ